MTTTRHLYGRSVIVIGTLDNPGEVVFHADGVREHDDALARSTEGEVKRWWKQRTRCGRVTYEASWRTFAGLTVPESYRHSDRGKRVHIDHAIRFARPCLQCWRIQPLELVDRAVA